MFDSKLRHGQMGERWVQAWLEASGRRVYVPGRSGSHPIDFFVVEASGAVWACDVKSYPRRARYDDTGVDSPDWEKYAQIALNVPVRLFFVDSFERYCYSVDVLAAAPVVRRKGTKVYIPLSVASIEFKLSDTQVRALHAGSTSSLSYSGTVPFFSYSSCTG